ncbi:MAG: hypothetical protein ACFFAK_11340 [Promethearchaeota archaeon]
MFPQALGRTVFHIKQMALSIPAGDLSVRLPLRDFMPPCSGYSYR